MTSTDDALRSPHSWTLALPAISAWACALALLGAPAALGAAVSLTAALSALAIALCTRGTPTPRRTKPSPLHAWPPVTNHLTALWTWIHAQPMKTVRADVRSLRLWRNTLIAVLGCSAAASAAVAFRVHAVTTSPVTALATRGATVTADIELTDDPRIRPSRAAFMRDSIVVEATTLTIQTGTVRQAVRAPIVIFASGSVWRTLLPSQQLHVTGRLAPSDPGNLTAAILLVRGPPRILTGPSRLQAVAGELRAGLRTASDVLPPDQRGLLPGLVVGDVSRMDPHVTADLKEAGLSHLNAVSGANLAIVAGAALALSRLAGLPLAARAVIAAIAMLAFAVVARPSPSVLRALLMGLTAAIALGTGRAKDGVAALSCSVLLLIMFDPELARSYGFALSVCATAGILLLAPRWRDRLAVRLPRWAAEAIAVPAAAQAAVTPVLVLMSGQLTLVAVPANLLAGPAVAPATLLGFAAALIAPFWTSAAQLVVRPAGYAVGWIILVAQHAVQMPFATAPWPGGLAGLAMLAVAVAIAVPILRRASWRWIVATLTVAALIGVLAVGPVVSSWPAARWLMVACDVGQGDGLVVSAGPGRAVVVDTGPDPVVMDRCLRDLDVTEIPLLILTHPHADHIGGLAGAVRGRRVGTILVSPRHPPTQRDLTPSGTDNAAIQPLPLASATQGQATDKTSTRPTNTRPALTTPGGTLTPSNNSDTSDSTLSTPGISTGLPAISPALSGLSPALSESGLASPRDGVKVQAALGGAVSWQVAVPGARWVFGPSEVTVLAPDGSDPADDGPGEGSVLNNSSVVVMVRWRAGTALLSGDIETEAQAELLQKAAPRADILKVPHHGSARQDPAFLAAVGARAALISVGADNDYGHPAPVTLGALQRFGATVYRTDLSGDLAVVDQDGHLAVIARGKR
ncbi:ComEC/Rec2 family competence protein [Nonomuraea sp. NPDC050556]|uniref:ComEC/Rec2 family competence protein n=1 Tax=Nonomuraea sp. NPDC050556 TaxID=3364369 RepID=UPI003787E67A